jgi:hypothetical protein
MHHIILEQFIKSGQIRKIYDLQIVEASNYIKHKFSKTSLFCAASVLNVNIYI